jgi:hypothetical protein
MIEDKYFLDNDLQYKKFKLSKLQKFIRISTFIIFLIFSNIIYRNVFAESNQTLKEYVLIEQIEQLKLEYDIINKRLNNSLKTLECLQLNDQNVYRVILNIDSIEKIISNTTYRREINYDELHGYENEDMMISTLQTLKSVEIKTMDQYESHKILEKDMQKWIHKMAHLPIISPVHTEIRRGDGIKFREVHPILGTPAWHHGQDFSTPIGTEVFATGAGIVTFVGWDDGLGNYISINHDYGYESLYGHLSEFKINKGDIVNRGDLIGLTGSTGWSTGPHLHYQINLYGKFQNPLFFFNDDLSEEEYYAMIDTLTSRITFKYND